MATEVKIVGDVSEVRRVVLIARRELHNEWATQEAALHYLSLDQGKEPSVLMHRLRARRVV